MNNHADPLNLIICGTGGQGNVLISRLLGRALTDNGYKVTIGDTFGAAQRGGAVFSSMRISKKKYYGPLVQEGQADVLLSLEPLESLRILNTYGNPEIATVSNSQPIYPVDYPDVLTSQGGEVVLRYDSNAAAGIGFRGNYRVVTFGFPFETISTAQERQMVMEKVLQYLR